MQDECILMLCRANLTRSPLAAAMLRRQLDGIGRGHVLVSSAGIEAAPGLSPSAETCQVAEDRGLDVSAHVSRTVVSAEIETASVVITMTEAQRAAVARLAPGAVSRTFTLAELSRLLRADAHRCSTLEELAIRAHRARPRTMPADGAEDVEDPVGRPLRHHQRLAERVAWLVEQVAAHVQPRTPAVPG